MKVREAIRSLVARGGGFSSGELAELTGLSRQALHRHLVRGVREGTLVRAGRGRATRYHGAGSPHFECTHGTAGLGEDRITGELAAWLESTARGHTPNAGAVLTYAVSEMVNNAIDHSGAASVTVRAELDGDGLRVTVEDAGVGAFECLRRGLELDDHLRALEELSKGKATTQPDRHTGEGIFFTSKMVDHFVLTANGLAWIVDNRRGDQTVREVNVIPGTTVELCVALDTTTHPTEVFARYTHDHEFDTTRCVVHLFEYGRDFVSRSEAKRLLVNLERFREVIVDFQGVDSVGQGFVDEVFRVWAKAHPDVRLVPKAMNAAVEFMVRRGLGRAETDG